ncbi:MAG: DNA topoisomerase I, partial [Bdellovibrionales bacterium]|nr:DNA topoisomerase I [Bdellovibrionales bacterium]
GDRGLKSQVAKQEKAINNEESRSIKLEGLDALSFRIGRYGAYVCRLEKGTGEEICASLPDNQFPGDITAEIANKLIDQKINGADALGQDPVSGLSVFVLSGRYGPYVQLGDSQGEETKPKRMAIPPSIEPENITLDQALQLLELPKTLGLHPDSGKEIKKGLGRFGPYVVHDGDFRSIPKAYDLFQVGLDKALDLLAQPKKVRGRSQPLRELGKHPQLDADINLFMGKYGPYVKCEKINASLAEDMKPESLSLEMAVELINQKLEAKGKVVESRAKKTPDKSSPVKKVKGSATKLSKTKSTAAKVLKKEKSEERVQKKVQKSAAKNADSSKIVVRRSH